MHRKMLEDASHEHLHRFIERMFDELKESNHEMYKELEEELYEDIYGCHFTEWLLEKALHKMHNEDGTMGGHWTIEQTTDVAKQHGIEFDTFNKYDFCYVMNMMYSDYYNVIPNDTSYYVKLTMRFINDKDGRRGKAYHYYRKIVE